MPLDTILVHLDAFDVHYFPCGLDLSDWFMEAHTESGYKVYFITSMEQNCYPEGVLDVDHWCNELVRWNLPGKQYFNMGMWVGFAAFVVKLFEAQLKGCNGYLNENGYGAGKQMFYFGPVFSAWHQGNVACDRHEEMFLSLSGHLDPPIRLVNGTRVDPLPPRTRRVCFMHGNGENGKARMEPFARARFAAFQVPYEKIKHTFPMQKLFAPR